jgi:hypothetical protein
MEIASNNRSRRQNLQSAKKTVRRTGCPTQGNKLPTCSGLRLVYRDAEEEKDFVVKTIITLVLCLHSLSSRSGMN